MVSQDATRSLYDSVVYGRSFRDTSELSRAHQNHRDRVASSRKSVNGDPKLKVVARERERMRYHRRVFRTRVAGRRCYVAQRDKRLVGTAYRKKESERPENRSELIGNCLRIARRYSSGSTYPLEEEARLRVSFRAARDPHSDTALRTLK